MSREYSSVVSYDELMYVWDKTPHPRKKFFFRGDVAWPGNKANKEKSLSREYNIVVSHDELMYVWDKLMQQFCYYDTIDFTVMHVYR